MNSLGRSLPEASDRTRSVCVCECATWNRGSATDLDFNSMHLSNIGLGLSDMVEKLSFSLQWDDECFGVPRRGFLFGK